MEKLPQVRGLRTSDFYNFFDYLYITFIKSPRGASGDFVRLLKVHEKFTISKFTKISHFVRELFTFPAYDIMGRSFYFFYIFVTKL